MKTSPEVKYAKQIKAVLLGLGGGRRGDNLAQIPKGGSKQQFKKTLFQMMSHISMNKIKLLMQK